MEATWKDHQRWIDKLTSEGKQKNEHLSFGSYLKLAQQEDNYLLKIKNTTIFGDLFSTVLSIIIAMSLLIGITFTFLSLAAFVQALFPACLVVSDKTPLPHRILLALACITISWILARFQKNIFTVDGAGTKLFGRPLTPDSHGYIATKWLVLIIPLLPVRSYKVVGEYSTAQDQARYFMEPIEKLDWIQIKETIWQWKVGYIIFILILIGLITLPLWKCI